MYGLPELARFFLLSNQIQSAGSSLFSHLAPPNLDGLVSPATSKRDPDYTGIGYDLSYLVGAKLHACKPPAAQSAPRFMKASK
jgi:hypothetical protein